MYVLFASFLGGVDSFPPCHFYFYYLVFRKYLCCSYLRAFGEVFFVAYWLFAFSVNIPWDFERKTWCLLLWIGLGRPWQVSARCSGCQDYWGVRCLWGVSSPLRQVSQWWHSKFYPHSCLYLENSAIWLRLHRTNSPHCFFSWEGSIWRKVKDGLRI